MTKIVIDTNVIVSAAVGKGYSKKILREIIFENTIAVCLSKNILDEYDKVSIYSRIQTSILSSNKK